MTTETEDLPDVLAGHWETSEGLDKAREYATKTRADLALSDRTDLGLANALYLVNGEIVIQTAAKERMRWLSVQLAIALSRTQAAEKALEEAGKALEAVQRIAGEGALHPSDVNHLRKTIMAMSSTATIALHRLGTPS
jgi:hypothetical protein